MKTFALVAAAFLTFGCSGGQSGQPTSSGSCPWETVDPDEAVNGVVPSVVANTFVGTHVEELAWFADAEVAQQGTWEERGGIGIDDEITVSMEYDGGRAGLRAARA